LLLLGCQTLKAVVFLMVAFDANEVVRLAWATTAVGRTRAEEARRAAIAIVFRRKECVNRV
jgi:hypothetical protein